MKKILLCLLPFSLMAVYSEIASTSKPISYEPIPLCEERFQGWSIDLGGQYSWMSFSSTTFSKFTGNTGGVHGSLTHQAGDSVYGQIRSYYNLGRLNASDRSAKEREFIADLLVGYSFSTSKNGMVTPYVGLGFDWLHEHETPTEPFTSIVFKYEFYYGIVGIDLRRIIGDYWALGVQVECFPILEERVHIKGQPSDVDWSFGNRVGVAVRLPTAYRIFEKTWLEVAPYYRYLPIGSSSVLDLSIRNLNQVGILATFRFFL